MGPAENCTDTDDRQYFGGPFTHIYCRCVLIPSVEPRKPAMNQSASVMLFEENGVRPCKVEYDPEGVGQRGNAQHTAFFKCVDPDVVKGDLVIVQTTTRQGFTIAKVIAIGYADVPVDFEDSTDWRWVSGRFDVASFKDIQETEKKLIGMVAEASANMMRAKLQEAMGLSKVSFKDVFIKAPTALASPHGAAPSAAPVPDEAAAHVHEGLADHPDTLKPMG